VLVPTSSRPVAQWATASHAFVTRLQNPCGLADAGQLQSARSLTRDAVRAPTAQVHHARNMVSLIRHRVIATARPCISALVQRG
jgi:hypothetical protein